MKELSLFLINSITLIFGAGLKNFDDAVCNSEECQTLSERYLLSMNPEADPCDDFYEFACGNYEKHYEITSLHKNTPLDEVKRNITIWWKDYLTNFDSEEEPSFLMELVRNYTKSCLDENHKTAQDQDDVREIINSQFGGWHLFDNDTVNEEHFEWEVLAGTLSLHGIHTFFLPYVEVDYESSFQNILVMTTHLKHRTTLKTEEIVTKIKKADLIREVFELIDIKNYNPKIVDDLVEFQLNINDLLQKKSGNYSHSGIQTTVAEFKNQHDNINWTAYFTQEMRDAMPHLLTPQERIRNEKPDFFNYLNDFLKDSSKETIKNFLFFELVIVLFKHMSKKYRKPFEKFSGSQYEFNKEYCAQETEVVFPAIVAGEYVKFHHTENDTVNVENMLENLKNVMIDEINNSTWMDRKSKEVAIEKVKRMRKKIGHPSWFSDLDIGTPYGILGQPVELSPYNFLKNYLTITKIEQIGVFEDLQYSSNSDWWIHVTSTNAFYSPHRNEMIIPAAILSLPFLAENSPISISYGGVGVIVAHEMTHGFDSQGRLYDQYAEQNYWMDDLTSELYDNKTQCFIDQYDSEIENKTGQNFDGTLTLDENIADNGAVKLSWLAYKIQAEKNLDARKLPNLEKYTSDQLYFISLASTQCISATLGARTWDLENDVHTFGATRVNVPLRNFPKFGEVFNCKIGSGMMPMKNETCQIW